MSTPIAWRPAYTASTTVVPAPAKASNTVCPGWLYLRIACAARAGRVRWGWRMVWGRYRPARWATSLSWPVGQTVVAGPTWSCPTPLSAACSGVSDICTQHGAAVARGADVATSDEWPSCWPGEGTWSLIATRLGLEDQQVGMWLVGAVGG